MNRTLLVGWFGLIAFFANFYAIAVNLANRRKVAALTPPTLSDERDAGRPIFLRPGVYVAATLLSVGGVLIVRDVTTSDSERLLNKCVSFENDERLVETKCSQSHDGKVVAVLRADGSDLCPRSADIDIVLTAEPEWVLCIDEDA